MKSRLAGIVISILILVGIGYFLADFISGMAKAKRDANEKSATISIEQKNIQKPQEPNTQEPTNKDELISKLRVEIKTLEERLSQTDTKNSLSQSPTSQVVQKIKAVKKPQKKLIYECYGYRVGGWEMSSACTQGLKEKITKESLANTVAIEVAPIVDSTPYTGPSSELKQEGLATFRVKSAKKELEALPTNQLPILQGVMTEHNNTRGFKLFYYEMAY